MREFPRPGRVIQRLGNMLPDVSGEINARLRASTSPGMGVTRLGVTTFAARTRPRVLIVQQNDESWCLQ